MGPIWVVQSGMGLTGAAWGPNPAMQGPTRSMDCPHATHPAHGAERLSVTALNQPGDAPYLVNAGVTGGAKMPLGDGCVCVLAFHCGMALSW